jgi:hypothetical protein
MIQTVHEVAPGIVQVSTAGHGGYWLSPERRADMPAQYRDIRTFAGGPWYEEDCDWSLVVLSFPEHFDAKTRQAAADTVEWLDANSERFIGRAKA